MNALSYISKIREKIGHDLLIYPGAGVIVYREGEILLQKRQDNGCWAIHGGGLEPGEEFEGTAVRELFEETGLKAHVLELFGLYAGQDRFLTYPNGDQIYMPTAVYLCRDFSGKLLAQLEEVSALNWFPFTDLPEKIHPQNQRILNDFLSKENL